MKKIAVVVPAHNEENRIRGMIDAYIDFFNKHPKYECTFVLVLNGCTDNTLEVVNSFESKALLKIIDMKEAGKGLAIKRGFEESLKLDAELIGFVDADMATKPLYFFELLEHMAEYDGIIGSRYMKDSKTYPPRPFIKEWGRRLFFQPLISFLFGLRFSDYQCGAKIFCRNVIEVITPELTVTQWAFDVELLYLCKLHGFHIREWPTTWHDQAGSKLKIMGPGTNMIRSLFEIKKRHANKAT